ncbi:MAG: type IV pilus assembly protein PilM [Nitrospirota bacterium]
MFSFLRSKDLVGLDIGSGALKLVQLKKAKRGYSLKKFSIFPIDPELIVDGAVMDSGQVVAAIRELFEKEKVKVKNVALSVSGHSVIVKRISLPLMSEDELQESIKWEAEQFIPFDINDVNVDFHILQTPQAQQEDGQMQVLLVAVKKDKLMEYTNLAMEAGLNPVIGDVDAFALQNMFTENYDVRESETVALVNIGASVMNINVLRGGVFSFTRDISTGGKQYNEAIEREMDLSFAQSERVKRAEAIDGIDSAQVGDIVQRLNSELVSEVIRSFDYFKTTSPNESIDRILVCGGGAKLSGLVSLLAERSGIAAEVANPFNRIEISPDHFDTDFILDVAPQAAVGVGLALRQVGDRWSE